MNRSYFQIRCNVSHVSGKLGCCLIQGFTLVEVMVAAAVFILALSGVYYVYGQSIRMLDGIRQMSRAEDIALANIEFLRTRSWTQLTNVVTTSSSSTTSQNSSNLIESVSATSSSSPVCTKLVLLSSDPLRIGLKNAQRDLSVSPYPGASSAETMREVTVTVSWDTFRSLRLTNSMTTYITKGGMTADVN